MPWFASTSFGSTRTTTLTCQEVTGWSPVATIPRMQQRPSLLRHSQGRIEHHAHCLIAPTGRTRRDPDHRVTDLRRGVAESPSADNARGCDCLTIATDWRSTFCSKCIHCLHNASYREGP